MKHEYAEPSTFQHLLDLALMALFLGVGVLICLLLCYPLFKRHFAYMDNHPRWYERED